MKPDTEKVLSILTVHENNAANLIAILQDVQAEYNYLSEANLTLIADALDISVSRVYSVATFYENFSLEAKGKHIIKVCAGTACHVRKSGPIYDAVYEYLGLSGKKKTSDDGLSHFLPAGKPAPPRPRRPESRISRQMSSSDISKSAFSKAA